MNQEINVAHYASLSRQQLQSIDALVSMGAEHGISYKIDPGTTSGIVYEVHGKTVGFMTVDCFNTQEIESTPVVFDEEIWQKMLSSLQTFAYKKGVQKLLFIASPADVIITQKLKEMGLSTAFTEYRMELVPNAFVPAPLNGVCLRAATADDQTYIMQLDTSSFGEEAHTVTEKDIQNTRLILLNGQPAGKLRIVEAEGRYGIYGVTVEKQLRGRGIGAAGMTLALEALLKMNVRHIFLEVNSENPAAFHLYHKLGFRVKAEFRYYPYKL